MGLGGVGETRPSGVFVAFHRAPKRIGAREGVDSAAAWSSPNVSISKSKLNLKRGREQKPSGQRGVLESKGSTGILFIHRLGTPTRGSHSAGRVQLYAYYGRLLLNVHWTERVQTEGRSVRNKGRKEGRTRLSPQNHVTGSQRFPLLSSGFLISSGTMVRMPSPSSRFALLSSPLRTHLRTKGPSLSSSSSLIHEILQELGEHTVHCPGLGLVPPRCRNRSII